MIGFSLRLVFESPMVDTFRFFGLSGFLAWTTLPQRRLFENNVVRPLGFAYPPPPLYYPMDYRRRPRLRLKSIAWARHHRESLSLILGFLHDMWLTLEIGGRRLNKIHGKGYRMNYLMRCGDGIHPLGTIKNTPLTRMMIVLVLTLFAPLWIPYAFTDSKRRQIHWRWKQA